MYKPGKSQATRLDIPLPRPGLQPLLTFAVMLAAGSRGSRKKYKLPEPVEEDIFE
jgi:glutamine synthetase